VKEGSVIAGKQIGKLDFASRMGVDIIAIRRNKDWIIDPKDSERVFRGDVLITRGAPQGVKDFKELVEGSLAKLEGK
jgi:trk system potassium uptake protein TrkA